MYKPRKFKRGGRFFNQHEINDIRHRVAHEPLAPVRNYSDYICAGIALVVALRVADYGVLTMAAAALLTGVVTKLTSPTVLNAVEDAIAEFGVEADPQYRVYHVHLSSKITAL